MTEYAHLPFNKYAKNIHSQNGEDGILRELFRKLKIGNRNKWCVEFGAWDGINLSNTFNLVEKGWNAIYIEGEPERFKDLLTTVKKFPKIIPILAFVQATRSAKNSLNHLLEKTPLPFDFELLSIDVDSIDLDIWDSLDKYRPKIVVIEINSRILPGISWGHSRLTRMNTFSATLNVAKEKKYTLVCHTGNLIFVRNDLMKSIAIDKKFIDHPELLFIPMGLKFISRQLFKLKNLLT